MRLLRSQGPSAGICWCRAIIYWQLRNSQQCWEQLEQSFGGENQHPELYAGAGRKPANGEMLQKNDGDATGAVELFLAAIQKSLAAPCQLPASSLPASLLCSNAVPKAELVGVGTDSSNRCRVTLPAALVGPLRMFSHHHLQRGPWNIACNLQLPALQQCISTLG